MIHNFMICYSKFIKVNEKVQRTDIYEILG